jgi:hypothetical protein
VPADRIRELLSPLLDKGLPLDRQAVASRLKEIAREISSIARP